MPMKFFGNVANGGNGKGGVAAEHVATEADAWLRFSQKTVI